MKICLQELIPKVLGDCRPDFAYRVFAFHGKGDLENSIPRYTKGMGPKGTKFLILRDQDAEDCREVKAHLLKLASAAGDDVMVRIVCHELEAWYFGDLQAVSMAYDKDVTGYAKKKGYRVPDSIPDPKRKLKRIFPEHQQISGAKAIAPNMDPECNTSESFKQFCSGLRRFVGAEENAE